PRPATVYIDAGVISSIAEGSSQSAKDWQGSLIVPGFVDVHNHGGAGGGFTTGTDEECVEAALYHRKHGTTTLWASLVSATGADLVAQIDLLASLADHRLVAGIHMEGPLITAARCSAQNPANIIDGDPQLFADAIAAGRGHLKASTIAPDKANSNQLFE